jgi:MGT family glycosyltransferase
LATILIGATPVYGHVAPMLAIGEFLVSRGHRVLMLTGTRFADRVTAAGLEFHPLTGSANFDDRDTDSYLPDRARHKPGVAQAQYDIQSIFVKTIPDQFRSVEALAPFVDGILIDSAFLGGSLRAFGTRPHPPVIACGVLPLSQGSRDVAPYGMGLLPNASPVGRIRNRAMQFVANRVLFRTTQNLAHGILTQIGAQPTSVFFMDMASIADRLLQLSTSDFEYPRSDLASNIGFVGPVIPPLPTGALPAWWGDLDGSRPVVHVTQGTIDNHDFGRLIRPTIAALVEEDVLVVVSLGGSADTLGPVPSNVRVAQFLPYDALLPLTDVFVTNAGYGGVQHALSYGVPIVAAGDTEDKPEVTARVEWSGVGVNLRTGTPTPKQVGDAVREVLGNSHYRQRATAIAASIAETTPLYDIEAELLALIAARQPVE